ncbi:ATP-binding protein [uncultured Chitinophaga sp.]|jgi:ATPases of the AAA+ class|uniref:ATP-binding protein n=1 Tax=uncultured Chitinophaga sp. TaxID=339340 RepID=UPI0026074996|nr:ATP-binding protein [uncultured Chitinophaga sp.]
MFTSSENAIVLNEYLQWLQLAVTNRLQQYFNKEDQPAEGISSTEPAPPVISYPQAPLPAFISEHALNLREQQLLLLALAPHISPVFFDEIIQQYIPKAGDFPQIGGVRGAQFRGFLPTGETALFLLAGNALDQRMEVKRLLQEERLFAGKQILRLENPPEGEPMMSGKIVLSQEYVDLFLTGHYTRPRFGASFPADRITTPLEWSDLVLNAQTREQVQELKKWLQYKHALLKTNKRLKPGYRVIFYGPPGTGKTLTACLLGKPETNNGQELDVYRVDLSQVVSKFIGETEKNLSKLFDKAEHKDWILFFDEADALFGKRTNIRDAHDKYANQEISYLLQRIENYNGLVILATNFKSNIDPAFARRFQAIIHFPMPNQAERLTLWKMILPDHMLQQQGTLERLAAAYELPGASIINVAQYCFLKNMQPDGSIAPISGADLEEGLIREFNKEGKVYK